MKISHVIFVFLILSAPVSVLFSHDIHDQPHGPHLMQLWNVVSLKNPIEASFLMFKNGEIYLEKADHSIVHFPLPNFSEDDQKILNEKIKIIQEINSQKAPNTTNYSQRFSFPWLQTSLFMAVLTVITVAAGRKRSAWVFALFALLLLMSVYGFVSKRVYTFFKTDPKEIDKAFKPFKPAVNTFWDDKYFYVESKGIPNHTMMKGITAWQQQVPIPQCYIGTNAWSIPLNPEIAAVPIPVNDKHFLRGAVAIAANGVAIFNPHTNTGVDAKEDGQLDIYGGHSGRADDYHYHIAPLQLHTLGQTPNTNAIAYALDGFAVYGALEPDGTAMKPLDVNHGHLGSDGVYHYHGTVEKPYMIGNMVGKVTEDNTLQIIPQAAAKGVRPALTPLQGAEITNCTPNASNNGYVLEYTRSGQKYAVDYSWTNDGKYTFKFVSPTGTTTSLYNGQAICSVPITAAEDIAWSRQIKIYPNPTLETLTIDPGENISDKEILRVTMYNLSGERVYQTNTFVRTINIQGFAKGAYLLNIHTKDHNMSKKVIIQ